MKETEYRDLKFEVYQELGECYTHTGRIDQAVKHFKKAMDINPQSERPFIGLGVAVMQKNKMEDAAVFFRKAIRMNPNNDNAITGLAMALSNNGSAGDALDRYQDALKINPINKTALLGLVQLSYSFNKYELAEKNLRKYLSHYPGNTRMLFCLAGTLFKEKKFTDARQVLDNIFIFEPDNADARELAKQIDEILQQNQYGKCQNS